MTSYHKHCPECGEPLARLQDTIVCPNWDFEKSVPPLPEVDLDPADFNLKTPQ